MEDVLFVFDRGSDSMLHAVCQAVQHFCCHHSVYGKPRVYISWMDSYALLDDLLLRCPREVKRELIQDFSSGGLSIGNFTVSQDMELPEGMLRVSTSNTLILVTRTC